MKTLLFLLMPFLMMAQVGINTEDPKYTFQVVGTVGATDIPTIDSAEYVLVWVPDADPTKTGQFKKIRASRLGQGGPTETATYFNQSGYALLESIVIYGRLLLNSNITLSPNTDIIQNGDLGGSDNQLRGAIKAGNRNISFYTQTVQNGSGYVTIEVLKKSDMSLIDTLIFTVPDKPINTLTHFIFNVNSTVDFIFRLKVSNGFKTRIKFLNVE